MPLRPRFLLTAGLTLALALGACAPADDAADTPNDMATTNSDVGADADAMVEGTEYHATGQVPCSTAAGEPTGSCEFGVTREADGAGTVIITRPDGSTRAIFFEGGEATSSDASEADGGAFSVERNGDLSIVHIGEERYEIPDAVVAGG